jgi:ribosomal protein S18 acetylase RimI-like enzyme
MADKITIRTCTKNDVGALLTLGIQTFRDTFDEFNSPENMRMYLSQNFTPDKIASEFNETGAVFFLAENAGLPTGYAKVRASKKPEGLNGYSAIEVERIYVHKDFLGKGVGQQLMQTCLDHAKQGGYNMIWLGVWEHNKRALDFYQKWGFEKFSQHTFMLGQDAQTDLLLKKKI